MKYYGILFSILFWPFVLFGQKRNAEDLRVIHNNRFAATASAFSHSGKILALANDDEIKLWDLRNRRITQSIKIPWLGCNEMAFKAGDSEIVMLGNRIASSHQPNFQNTKDDITTRIQYLPVISQLNIRSQKISDIIDSSNLQRELSSDGRYIAELSDSGELTLREVRGWNTIASIQLPIDTTMVKEGRRRKLANGKDTIILEPSRRNPAGLLWFMTENKKLAVRWYNKLMIFKVSNLHKLATFLYSAAQTLGDGIYLPPYLSTFIYDLRTESLSVTQPVPLIILPPSVDSAVRSIEPSKVYLFDKVSLMASQYSMFKSIRVDDEKPPRSSREDTVVFSFNSTQEPWGMRLDSNMHIVNNSDDGKILLFSNRSSLMTVNVISHEVRKIEDIIEMK